MSIRLGPLNPIHLLDSKMTVQREHGVFRDSKCFDRGIFIVYKFDLKLDNHEELFFIWWGWVVGGGKEVVRMTFWFS